MNTRKQTIQWGMAFPMEVITQRYSRDHGIPIKVARTHEQEIKRFLILCALNTDMPYAMRGPMDNIWHTFLMFTKDYMSFCEGLAGGFIHHVPADVDEDSPDESKERYLQFLVDYEAEFGEAPPEHLWPRPEVSSKGCYPKCGKPCKVSPAMG
jgi:hypothetical protein